MELTCGVLLEGCASDEVQKKSDFVCTNTRSLSAQSPHPCVRPSPGGFFNTNTLS